MAITVNYVRNHQDEHKFSSTNLNEPRLSLALKDVVKRAMQGAPLECGLLEEEDFMPSVSDENDWHVTRPIEDIADAAERANKLKRTVSDAIEAAKNDKRSAKADNADNVASIEQSHTSVETGAASSES